MKRSKTSKSWMSKHVSDVYVKKAQQAGYRSRAAFKLIEADEKFQFFKKNIVAVDLGAAPGSWSQVLVNFKNDSGSCIALDLLEMDPIKGVDFIKGDFREAEVLKVLENKLNSTPLDLVISDMAPNITGVKSVDQSRWLNLAELALDFAQNYVRRGGSIVVKCFEGEGSQEFCNSVRSVFRKVHRRKPQASRDRSSEFFIVGLNKIG